MMMLQKSILFLILLSIFCSSIFAKTFSINNDTDSVKLIPHSQIYIDRTQKLTIENITKQELPFKDSHKELLAFGYSPEFNVWIKLTFFNDSDTKLSKVIEYVNPLTTHISFYDPDKKYEQQLGGMFFKQKDHTSLNSIFHISLEPKETKTYYLKASSHITTLIVELTLWDEHSFYTKEIKHQIILSLFFGAMMILGIYNLFIFFFTKDISYLYYVTYIFGLILHQLVYVGVAGTYFFSSEEMRRMIEYSPALVALPVFALGLFTKSFLHTKQYIVYNKILNLFLVLIPLGTLFFLLTDQYDSYRNIFTMLLLLYLLYLTIYASFKKNKQAYFILFGWSIFVFTGMLMFLSSLGVFSISNYFPYLIEISFLLEAIIFSIALANKINNLQKEKNKVHKQLIKQKKKETKRLEKQVKKKTKNLVKALDEKNILLKELHHRVKNNMQTIISLIRLQLTDVDDEKLESQLKTIQNRVSAMSHLHELLYKQHDFNKIKTHEYFNIIIAELRDSYGSDVKIDLKITADLTMDEAIYCGLILNELITNSMKYAFQNIEDGMIWVSLSKNNTLYSFEVKDNGIGYEIDKGYNSLGLTLVETLATGQLDGIFKVEYREGTHSKVLWEHNE